MSCSAAYGVLRFVMESGAKGCEVIISGKLRAARAKSMKFKDGYMVSSGQPANMYIDAAVRHVLLRQGTLGLKVRQDASSCSQCPAGPLCHAKSGTTPSCCHVKIMKDYDPTGKIGPKTPMPDFVKVLEPKEDEYVASKPLKDAA
eukprot:353183-Chlamydomonas_euryale.AAC.10